MWPGVVVIVAGMTLLTFAVVASWVRSAILQLDASATTRAQARVDAELGERVVEVEKKAAEHQDVIVAMRMRGGR